MDCAICYEAFIINKTREEFNKICKDAFVKNDFKEFVRLESLYITPQHNTTHMCSTPNCECILCHTCFIKIKEADENDIFICPYCRL
jgi:hypothetical protein